ncbi:hypothetical protein ACH41E_34185 [Streptomyces sp. NPDC020412]|uniref:DUF7224 domain-containing protein n=1 Tax=Streptomyces sp. NPDC020412 TaxID=3365073 RepID=UPI0037B92051
MRTTTLLRSGPVLWVAVVLLPLLLWTGEQNTRDTMQSWTAATAASLMLLGYVSAACGACAAWESARLHRARVADWAPVRGPLSVAALHLAPVAALGLLGVLTNLAVFAPEALDTPGHPDPSVLLTAYAVVLAHIGVGWLVGPLMPGYLGAAAMLVGGYLWGFWPAALESPAFLRHLNGQGLDACCGLDQTTAPRSTAATLLFSVGLIAAAVVCTALGRKVRSAHLRYAALPLALATAGAVALALPLGYGGGVQARDRAERTCTDGPVAYCLWPEQEERRADVLRWAKDAERRLRAVGVTPAAEVEFGAVAPTEDQVRWIVGASPLPLSTPDCPSDSAAIPPAQVAYSTVYAWLSLTAGEPADHLARRTITEHVDAADRVRQSPVAQQRAWYAHNLRAIRDCSVRPSLDPASFGTAGATP